MLFNFKVRNAKVTKFILGSEDDHIALWEKGCEVFRDAHSDFPDSIDLHYIEKLALITQTSIKNSFPNWNHGLYVYLNILKLVKELNLTSLRFLDIGTGKGFSSVVMAKCALDLGVSCQIDTIDILPAEKSIFWNSISDVRFGKITRRQLLKNYDLELRSINFFEMRSQDFFKYVSPALYDFIFIDGDHRFRNVYKELINCSRILTQHGQMFLDDYDEIKFPGVINAVDRFLNLHSDFKVSILGNLDRKYALLSRI
jgi:hypothetical protein